MNELEIIYAIVVLILVLIAAFFSAAETGITTSSKGKIHRLAKDGNDRAKRVEKLMKNKESLMGTILMGNNVVNILASAIAASLFIKIFGESGVLYATITMTFLILIFGEIAPKTYALKKAEVIALAVVYPLTILVKIFYPITKRIQKMVDFAINLFSSNKKEDSVSDIDEIRGTVELKHQEGSIFKYDKDMISSILDFGEMAICDVMTHRKNIKSIDIDQDIDLIIKQALNTPHTRIPLWQKDKDNVVAILNIRKLMRDFNRFQGDVGKINLDEISSKPWFVPETNSLRSQLFAFRRKEKRFAAVIDEYGALLGIITLEDILEEIVGSISESGDGNMSKIIKSKDSSYKLSAEITIRDINRELNWNLPDDDNASTLAGLVISKIERIPEEGEEFEFDGFTFSILKKKQNKIILLKVKKVESKLKKS